MPEQSPPAWPGGDKCTRFVTTAFIRWWRDASSEWDFQVVGANVLPGILWAGQAPLQIQQCPSCDIKSPTATDPYTGYNYNTSYIGHGVGEFQVQSARVVQVRRPSEVALFGDGGYYGGTDKYMRARCATIRSPPATAWVPQHAPPARWPTAIAAEPTSSSATVTPTVSRIFSPTRARQHLLAPAPGFSLRTIARMTWNK